LRIKVAYSIPIGAPTGSLIGVVYGVHFLQIQKRRVVVDVLGWQYAKASIELATSPVRVEWLTEPAALSSVEDQWNAYFFGLVERGCFYDINLAYAESFEKLSPGAHLTQSSLEQLSAAGVHTVISHGAHEYKKHWATRFVPQKRVPAEPVRTNRKTVMRHPTRLNRTTGAAYPAYPHFCSAT
jgi:hypothetical protein